MTLTEGAVIVVSAPYGLVLLLRGFFKIPGVPAFSALFIAGAATAFVALVGEDLVWPVANPLLPQKYAMLVRAFLMIALIEELAKTALISGQIDKYGRGDFRIFALVAAMIGAGFAATENCLYLLRFGPQVVLIRVLTATPFHICNAVVASRLVWVGMIQGKAWGIPFAIFVAVFLHGLYDYEILTDSLSGKFWFAWAITASTALRLLRSRT